MHPLDRRLTILNAIIKEFIETAEPVGSHAIVMGYRLSVSPATVRNEMMNLEEEGLIFQPHISAGRIPTDTGYRVYVNELADYAAAEKQASRVLQKVMDAYALQKTKEKIYDAVSILSQATDEVSFATLPDNKRTFYLGISNVLRQPEFSNNSLAASQVIEVLEDTDHFVKTLRKLQKASEVQILIGKENILPKIKSCTIIIGKYNIEDFEGFFGLLGPTRMRYPFNYAMVKKVIELLQ